MNLSLRPRRQADPLVEMEEAKSIGELDSNIRAMFRWQREHEDRHRWERRAEVFVFGIVAGLVGWGAGQFHDATTADSRDGAKTAATQIAESARAEHGELRSADKELSEKISKLDREFQLISQQRMKDVREAKPR